MTVHPILARTATAQGRRAADRAADRADAGDRLQRGVHHRPADRAAEPAHRRAGGRPDPHLADLAERARDDDDAAAWSSSTRCSAPTWPRCASCPDVIDVAASDSMPLQGSIWSAGLALTPDQKAAYQRRPRSTTATSTCCRRFGLQLVAGRNFTAAEIDHHTIRSTRAAPVVDRQPGGGRRAVPARRCAGQDDLPGRAPVDHRRHRRAAADADRRRVGQQLGLQLDAAAGAAGRRHRQLRAACARRAASKR